MNKTEIVVRRQFLNGPPSTTPFNLLRLLYDILNVNVEYKEATQSYTSRLSIVATNNRDFQSTTTDSNADRATQLCAAAILHDLAVVGHFGYGGRLIHYWVSQRLLTVEQYNRMDFDELAIGNTTRHNIYSRANDTLIFHTIHLTCEVGFSTAAILCSLFIIYLAVYRTKNKAVQVYSHMLIMNASVDLSYSICNLIAMPIFFIYDGYFILAAGNPILKSYPWSANIVTSCQGFLIYVSVVIIPIQFIYRYSVIRNKPYTSGELLKIFIIGGLYPFGHGILCFYTFTEPTPLFDKTFELDPVISSLDYIPPYRVGDCVNSKLMALHIANCMAMTIASYVIIMVVYRMTKTEFIKMESQMSDQTKRVQKQMEQVIFIQAIFPILVLFIPGTVLPIAALWKINYRFTGEFVAIMHTTPVFNSFSVILCVPSYRRIFTGMFYKNRNMVSSSKQGDKKTHTTHDSDLFEFA
ncbi:unnamed protein product [Bursaphelenchus okinawaensis]|uniref:G_PROTEIN_RECEP_F1_2 domain-containing protein n=1 Tax=Bursaphelenchus okinawaensis TaxID=465554 RepID=A0A811L182_9BILA|nr:unnamed protein product [Bursaphelenchus okinawaensis]CAG9114362.1 unnamed protein product [Bursaphelenchus okinawaensis]